MDRPLPYGRHSVDEDDINAVVETLRGQWLTTGPMLPVFEREFASRTGAKHAVAVSSGTAALHAMVEAADVGPGDEVIVPAITFVATANVVVMQGARPVFADVHPETLLLDPSDVERKIGPRTRAVIAVDYAGQPCDYAGLRIITGARGSTLLCDACHALGATYQGRRVGAIADLSAFSFHPVKHITAGEGGCVTTDNALLAERMRRFRNHGIDSDHRSRAERGTWRYEMGELGYNYRLTDFQCALAASQLKKLDMFLERRRALARQYDESMANIDGARPLAVVADRTHAYHLYVIRVERNGGLVRDDLFRRLRAEGIGANVHYAPVHLQPFYRRRFGTQFGDCPHAEAAAERILTLPLFPTMTNDDVERIVAVVRRTLHDG